MVPGRGIEEKFLSIYRGTDQYCRKVFVYPLRETRTVLPQYYKIRAFGDLIVLFNSSFTVLFLINIFC